MTAPAQPSDAQKAFTTWTFGGVKFVAFDMNGGVFVVDENGNGYGLFMSVVRFRELQRDGSNDLIKPFPGVRYGLTCTLRNDVK